MYNQILVPLDGSSFAEQALEPAILQARCFGAEISLLRVLEPLPEATLSPHSAVKAAEELSGQLARDYLASLAAGIQEQGIPTQFATVEGRPYVEIIKFAEDKRIDLIVMTTRGHSGLSRWLLGSVTDRVVRGARVPILLIQCAPGDDG